MAADTPHAPRRVVLVGAGPRSLVLLGRIAAHAASTTTPFEVHLVDPHPKGAGRIWRDDQSDLLRLNTTAEDLTVHTDGDAGPSLADWLTLLRPGDLGDDALEAEAREIGRLEFPTRRLSAAYFDRTYRRAVESLPAHVRVVEHAQKAVDVRDQDGRRSVVLADGTSLDAAAVVLLTSHVDQEPTAEAGRLAHEIEAGGGVFVGPGYGADLDLSSVPAGEDVVVRGLGLGFVDVMVLLTEGRGGAFHRTGTGDRLRYEPSGREPHLLVGSRRGVPFHCKPMYRLVAGLPDGPRFLTPDVVAGLVAEHDRLDLAEHVWPLVERELTWSYYRELALGHPDRVAVAWADLDAALEHEPFGSTALEDLLAWAVPDPDDRLDLRADDRPLAGLRLPDVEALGEHVAARVRADVDRRTDPRHSADLGLFHGLLRTLGALGPVLASPTTSVSSRLRDFDQRWFGFFSYYASGPPPDRLEQLLALHEAGIVDFLGAGLEVDVDPDTHEVVATSRTIPGEVRARALVEATVPAPDVTRTRDVMLAALRDRGDLQAQRLVADDGSEVPTGRVVVDAGAHVVDADGAAHPWLLALGMHTTAPVAAFARPGSNGPVHRQADVVARDVVALATAARPAPVTTTKRS
ncbi:FAD/NAD(P)-binding protein [Solicola sp. PLA-1-18]|uniref:FAD/NAD(P)-binding protein n=1 Tax=Solicola sp. PLA-1-18 TaxID=3380532 RepID=UPI003B7DBEC1